LCGREWRGRAVAVAIGARRPAGHEGEGGAGRRLGREYGAVVEREQSPVEEFSQLHAAAGVGAAARAWRDLQPARAEADGVVAGDRHQVAAAEEPVEIARRPAPDGGRVGGGAREAPVEVGDELWQEALGGLAGGEAAQAQFTGQAILQRRPESFDTALGLRRVSGDVRDAQVLGMRPRCVGC
jgi:hypothetical protein